MTGGFYEAGLWTDAVLLWDRNDASAVYSGNPLDFDFYYRLSGIGISPVLLLTDREAVVARDYGQRCKSNFQTRPETLRIRQNVQEKVCAAGCF